MDEITIQNEVNAKLGEIGKQTLDKHMTDFMAWDKKYAKLPIKVGKHWVWRKHYWRRICMLDDMDYVIALEQPRLEGYYYGVHETLNKAKVQMQKTGVIKLSR